MALYVRKYLAFSASDIGSGLAANIGGVLGTSPATSWGVVQQTLGVPLAEIGQIFVSTVEHCRRVLDICRGANIGHGNTCQLDIGPILASRTKSGRGACPSVCLLVGGPVTITIVFKKGNAWQ